MDKDKFDKHMLEQEKKILKDMPELKCCDDCGWERPYSQFLLDIRRYRIPYKCKCNGCELPGGVFEDNIHMLMRLLPSSGRDFVDIYWGLRNKYPGACWHGVQLYFRARTGLLKMGGPRISSTWREECYWEAGYGFVSYKHEDTLIPEVLDWLVYEKEIGHILGGDVWEGMCYDELRTIMEEEWTPPSAALTIQEWVASGRWMEGRSGTGERGVVVIDGKRIKTSRHKGVDGVTYSDEQIVEELQMVVDEEMYILQKSESGKIRPVVKTGNKINRKMNFLSTYLEREVPRCFLYFFAAQNQSLNRFLGLKRLT